MTNFFKKRLSNGQADLTNLMQENNEEILSSLKKLYKGTEIKVSELPEKILNRKYPGQIKGLFFIYYKQKIISLEVDKSGMFEFTLLNSKNGTIIIKNCAINTKLKTFSENTRIGFLNFLNSMELDKKSFTEVNSINTYIYKRILEEFELSFKEEFAEVS